MFRLAAIFGDGMVLARRKELRVFGTADDGATLTAALGGATAATKAVDGRFTLRLPPMEAQTGLTLTVSDGDTSVTLSDVAIGEVYLAGGQSNMERELKEERRAEEIIGAHNDPDLRFYNVPKCATIEDAVAAEEHTRWACARPGALGDVSAAAYFFALRLRERFGVPVGIIDCYWGGTMAACWLDETALERTASGRAELDEYREATRGLTLEKHAEDMRSYTERQERWNRIAEQVRRDEPEADYARLLEVAGDNPWPPPQGPLCFRRPGGLAEAMLLRVAPYSLNGFLYYQGESDFPHADRYYELLMTLVLRWRELFMDASLPFINTQLPVYADDAEYSWAVLRLAQARVRDELRNTGLAILLDTGDAHDVHPRDKEPVGERLFEQALKVAYGLPCKEAPRALSKQTDGKQMLVRVSAPLAPSRDGFGLFELAGDDGVFYAAHAVTDGDIIAVESELVEYPSRVRYAYINYAPEVVTGVNGLPLEPFFLS